MMVTEQHSLSPNRHTSLWENLTKEGPVNTNQEKCRALANEISTARKAAKTAADMETVLAKAESALSQCSGVWALQGAAAWVLRDARIKNIPQGTPAFDTLAVVKRIGELTDPNRYGPVSCWVTAVNDVLLHWSRSEDSAELGAAVDLIKLVDESQLVRERGTFNDRTQPSQAERFFPNATKLVARSQGNDGLLIRLAEAALKEDVQLGEPDARWIRYRLAKVILDSDPERARTLLEEATKESNESAILRLLVTSLRRCGEQERARDLVEQIVVEIDAAQIKYMVSAFSDLAELSDNPEVVELSTSVAQLAKSGQGVEVDLAQALMRLRRLLR